MAIRARVADLGYAGGLLSRLAKDTRGKLGDDADVDTSFIDALRPAFVVQGALSAGEIPSVEPAPAGDVTRWRDPPGGAGAERARRLDQPRPPALRPHRPGRGALRHAGELLGRRRADTPFARGGCAGRPAGRRCFADSSRAALGWRRRQRGPLAPVAGGDARHHADRRHHGRSADRPRRRRLSARQDRRARAVDVRLRAPRGGARRRRRTAGSVAGVYRMPRGPSSAATACRSGWSAATDSAIYTRWPTARSMRTDLAAERSDRARHPRRR